MFSHIIRIISKMDKIVNKIDGVKNGSVGAGRGGGVTVVYFLLLLGEYGTE